MAAAGATATWESLPGTSPGRADRRAFFAVSALLFAASAVLTIVWCGSMTTAAGMPMPGGWTMSMAWMRMPGQSWPGAAFSFLGMWTAMMVAMMLPSLLPVLWSYRRAVGMAGEPHPDRLVASAGAAYYFVWTLFGMLIYPLGLALAAIEMRLPELARAVPVATGLVVLTAGALQFTAWKARALACCRETPGCGRHASLTVGAAWRHGLRFGFRCVACCSGPMAVLLVVGVMDLRAMALVTAAVSAERLAPAGARVARAAGVCAVAAGWLLMARALGF
jgi:predicted metal-binding membrane protein